MSKFFSNQNFFLSFLAIGLGVSAFSGKPGFAQMFQPPGDEAPITSKGGGTRTDNPCFSDAAGSPSAIPLLPTTQIGLTVATHPAILVYIPQSSVKQVFFSLQDENGNHYYQAQFAVPHAGVAKIRFPQEAPPLEIGKKYMWSLALICGSQLEPDSPTITGWVQRRETTNPTWTASPSLEQASALGQAGLWYDMMASLAQLKQAQPNDPTVVRAWQTELTSVGLGTLASQPVLN
ncbi:MAG: DUF928 domain-containing protein [Microcoleaceae cyanobacterium]